MFKALLLAVVLSISSGSVSGQESKPPITISAEEKARFDKAADYSTSLSGHGVLIMRGGQVIYERYDNGWTESRPHPLASGTKSFTGVAAMIAVGEGLFTLDELVSDTITEWKNDPEKAKITVRHLLTLSSGLQPDTGPSVGTSKNMREVMERTRRDDWFTDAINAPMTGKAGGQFAYGGNHYYAFGEFFNRKLKAGKSPYADIWAYYEAKIFTPIGLEVGRIGRDKAGHPNLPGGALLTAREWAKFGQLVLHNGEWTGADGKKTVVVKPELLAECFVPSAKNPSYGLTWWLMTSRPGADTNIADGVKEEKKEEPAPTARPSLRERLQERAKQKNFAEQSEPVIGPDGKPIEVRMAAGLGKQRLYVLPQFDMVIVRFADLTSSKGRDFDNREFLAPILNLEKK